MYALPWRQTAKIRQAMCFSMLSYTHKNYFSALGYSVMWFVTSAPGTNQTFQVCPATSCWRRGSCHFGLSHKSVGHLNAFVQHKSASRDTERKFQCKRSWLCLTGFLSTTWLLLFSGARNQLTQADLVSWSSLRCCDWVSSPAFPALEARSQSRWNVVFVTTELPWDRNHQDTMQSSLGCDWTPWKFCHEPKRLLKRPRFLGTRGRFKARCVCVWSHCQAEHWPKGTIPDSLLETDAAQEEGKFQGVQHVAFWAHSRPPLLPALPQPWELHFRGGSQYLKVDKKIVT